MITAEEKREQMNEDYWFNFSLERIGKALEEVDPHEKKATFNLHIPKSLRLSVTHKVEVYLREAGYEVTRIINPNDFNNSLMVKWAD